MKTFIYTYERGRNDRNGNPRHWVTVYKLDGETMEPVMVVDRAPVGYYGEDYIVREQLTVAGELVYIGPYKTRDGGFVPTHDKYEGPQGEPYRVYKI